MNKRFDTIQDMLEEPLNFGKKTVPKAKRELPKAYIEWASSPEASTILHKYSNTDKFWFKPTKKDIVSTDAGDIVLFTRESQGNFSMGVLLDTGNPDPPVMYSDYHAERWIQHCERFSDALFAQIFDWQYRLCFDEDGYAEIDFSKTFNVKSCDDTLAGLRDAYTEHPATQWFFETDQDSTVWRFSTPEGERILLSLDPGSSKSTDKCWIEVLAPEEDRFERVRSLSEQLRKKFA